MKILPESCPHRFSKSFFHNLHLQRRCRYSHLFYHTISYDKIPLRFGVFSFFLSCFQLKLSKILKNPFVFENPIYDFKKFSGESDIGFCPSASGLDSFVEIE